MNRKVTVSKPTYPILRFLPVGALLEDAGGEAHLLVYNRVNWELTRFDGTVTKAFADRADLVDYLRAAGWAVLPPGTEVTLTA